MPSLIVSNVKSCSYMCNLYGKDESYVLAIELSLKVHYNYCYTCCISKLIRFYVTSDPVGTFKVNFTQLQYEADENNGSVCIGLNLINQSSFDHNITVEFTNVNHSTNYNGYATGKYVSCGYCVYV